MNVSSPEEKHIAHQPCRNRSLCHIEIFKHSHPVSHDGLKLPKILLLGLAGDSGNRVEQLVLDERLVFAQQLAAKQISAFVNIDLFVARRKRKIKSNRKGDGKVAG